MSGACFNLSNAYHVTEMTRENDDRHAPGRGGSNLFLQPGREAVETEGGSAPEGAPIAPPPPPHVRGNGDERDAFEQCAVTIGRTPSTSARRDGGLTGSRQARSASRHRAFAGARSRNSAAVVPGMGKEIAL